MNNMPYPYMPMPLPAPLPMPNNNYEEEINNLKHEIKKLKERVNALENKSKKNYLKKEDGLYMMKNRKNLLFFCRKKLLYAILII